MNRQSHDHVCAGLKQSYSLQPARHQTVLSAPIRCPNGVIFCPGFRMLITCALPNKLDSTNKSDMSPETDTRRVARAWAPLAGRGCYVAVSRADGIVEMDQIQSGLAITRRTRTGWNCKPYRFGWWERRLAIWLRTAFITRTAPVYILMVLGGG
mgnify:FL=1